MRKLKEPKTLIEQEEYLKDIHDLVTNKKTAPKILSCMNYYVIKGYGLEYINNPSSDNYKYIDKTNLEEVYEIFNFDNKLRTLLIWIIGIIEKNIRTKTAVYLSTYDNKKFGAECYSVPDIYLPKRANAQMKEFADVVSEISKWQNDPVIKHHIRCYGKFPIWVLIEYIDFGKLKKFILSLKQNFKDDIARMFNFDNFLEFDYFLDLLKNLRNVCCHYRRIYGKRFACNIPADLKLQHLHYIKTTNDGKGNITCYFNLYSILYVVRNILKHLEYDDEWKYFYDELIDLLHSKPKKVNSSKLGFTTELLNLFK